MHYNQDVKSFLQIKQWTDLKVSQGWLSHEIEGIFVLEKKLPFGKSFLYAPEVDFEEINSERSRGMENFLENTKEIAKKNNSIFFRLEILDQFDEKIIENLKNAGFIKSFEEVQPEHRQIIDISKSENEILAQMKPKGRYNIKIAQKHNVIIENPPADEENIADFYQIFRETAKRDHFKIRPPKYFQNLMQILEPEGLAELWQAKYNSRTIAAVIVVFYNKVATYLYGASKNEFRNLMAPYLLHWRLMQRAKERGCQVYDLLAVGPEDGGQKTENGSHKYAGITRFKEQFGGQRVQIVGSYDLVYQPTWYKIFKMAERYRRK